MNEERYTHIEEIERIRKGLQEINTEEMSILDYMQLKQVLKSVSTTITYLTTKAFVERYLIAKPEYEAAGKKILSDLGNETVKRNVYDIEYADDNLRFIAEVKCNIPVSAHTFGPTQRATIIKDIEGLATCAKKTKCKHYREKINKRTNPYGEYIKFMIFLDAEENVTESVRKIISDNKPRCVLLKECPVDFSTLDPKKIYFILIRPSVEIK